ncbi:MAG: alpha/beta hydrolase [Spirochaetales bacterium]|nr:alpha/beta hydrolase [Spirochaetales bacterium]
MRKIYIFFIIVLCASCTGLQSDGDFVYVSYKGADMPVLVEGNKDSGIFIIYVHGGPGGSSFIDIHNKFFDSIEEQYAMVFYDQRASGNSKGQVTVDQLNLEQFIEDLDVITEYIKQTYSPTKLVLLGHSWGGTLGTAYLLDSDRRQKYDGWIEVDGGHNIGDSAFAYSKQFVLDKVNEELSGDLGSSKRRSWESIKTFYDGLTSWRDSDIIISHSKYVRTAGGYFYNSDNSDGLVPVSDVLFSETNYIALLAQNEFVVRNMDIWFYNFTDQLSEIDIPTYIAWGRHDGILPVQLGEEAIASFGLTEDDYYIFEESAHSPHYEQTALFNEKIINFIKNNIED